MEAEFGDSSNGTLMVIILRFTACITRFLLEGRSEHLNLRVMSGHVLLEICKFEDIDVKTKLTENAE